MTEDLKITSLNFDGGDTSGTPYHVSFSNGTSATWTWNDLLQFQDDGEGKKDKDDESEDMEGDEGGLDVAAVCKAIESGEISIADFAEIKAAMDAAGTEEADEAGEEVSAPVPDEGPGDLMKTNRFAKMQAEIDANKLKLSEREDADAGRAYAEDQTKRFKGRNVGEDFEAKAREFFKTHGAVAAKAYHDELFALVPPAAGMDFEAALTEDASLPEDVKKLCSSTESSVEAHKAMRQWEDLKSYTRVPRDEFVRIALERAGIDTSGN